MRFVFRFLYEKNGFSNLRKNPQTANLIPTTRIAWQTMQQTRKYHTKNRRIPARFNSLYVADF